MTERCVAMPVAGTRLARNHRLMNCFKDSRCPSLLRSALVLFAFVLAGCGQEEPVRHIRPEGLYDSCADGGTCQSPFACMNGPALLPQDGTGEFCTQRCESVADCPRVWSEHCGEQTRCVENLCSYTPCR